MEQAGMSGGRRSLWQRAESVIFPAAAAVIGLGYAFAIVVNNPLDKVLHSPHALILIAIFLAIAFFPIRTLLREIGKPAGKSD